MYNIEELNDRLLSELREIADGLGIKNYKRAAKKDLIYMILDEQAVNPAAASENKETKIKSTRESESIVVKKEEPAPKSEDAVLESFNLDVKEGEKTKEPKSESKPKADKPERKEKKDAQQKDGQQQERNDRRQEQKNKKAEYNANVKEFDGVIENGGVLEIMQDGYGS